MPILDAELIKKLTEKKIQIQVFMQWLTHQIDKRDLQLILEQEEALRIQLEKWQTELASIASSRVGREYSFDHTYSKVQTPHQIAMAILAELFKVQDLFAHAVRQIRVAAQGLAPVLLPAVLPLVQNVKRALQSAPAAAIPPTLNVDRFVQNAQTNLEHGIRSGELVANILAAPQLRADFRAAYKKKDEETEEQANERALKAAMDRQHAHTQRKVVDAFFGGNNQREFPLEFQQRSRVEFYIIPQGHIMSNVARDAIFGSSAIVREFARAALLEYMVDALEDRYVDLGQPLGRFHRPRYEEPSPEMTNGGFRY